MWCLAHTLMCHRDGHITECRMMVAHCHNFSVLQLSILFSDFFCCFERSLLPFNKRRQKLRWKCGACGNSNLFCGLVQKLDRQKGGIRRNTNIWGLIVYELSSQFNVVLLTHRCCPVEANWGLVRYSSTIGYLLLNPFWYTSCILIE